MLVAVLTVVLLVCLVVFFTADGVVRAAALLSLSVANFGFGFFVLFRWLAREERADAERRRERLADPS